LFELFVFIDFFLGLHSEVIATTTVVDPQFDLFLVVDSIDQAIQRDCVFDLLKDHLGVRWPVNQHTEVGQHLHHVHQVPYCLEGDRQANGQTDVSYKSNVNCRLHYGAGRFKY